jgi:hypothetical protein
MAIFDAEINELTLKLAEVLGSADDLVVQRRKAVELHGKLRRVVDGLDEINIAKEIEIAKSRVGMISKMLLTEVFHLTEDETVVDGYVSRSTRTGVDTHVAS